jgi:DNA modification methylase
MGCRLQPIADPAGVVALDLGRRFVGYEINGDFSKLCEQRLGSLNEVENTL